MRKVLIFGNSGAGKSTLARELHSASGLAHMDLDPLAWLDTKPPQRAPIAESRAVIERFMQDNESWVIEGCYTDLLEVAVPAANEMIYLNLPIHQCIENARNREWEPHKYSSKASAG